MKRRVWTLVGLLMIVAVVVALTPRDKAEAQIGVGIPRDFANPTIVATWHPTVGRESCFANVEFCPGQKMRIKGAGFQYGKPVLLTICSNDKVLCTVTPNRCGAFATYAVIPTTLVPIQVGSVKAWDVATRKLLAVWPVDIVRTIIAK